MKAYSWISDIDVVVLSLSDDFERKIAALGSLAAKTIGKGLFVTIRDKFLTMKEWEIS
jgi:hypothetical protein